MLISNKPAYKAALDKVERYEHLVREFLIEPRNSDRSVLLERQIRHAVRPGFYEHFKSSPELPMFYQVVGVCGHVNYTEDRHAFQVVYAAQYGRRKGWQSLRELLGPDGFLTPISRIGYIGPRFKYVGRLCPRRSSGGHNI